LVNFISVSMAMKTQKYTKLTSCPEADWHSFNHWDWEVSKLLPSKDNVKRTMKFRPTSRGTGAWTQGLTLVRQVLYHLSHAPALHSTFLILIVDWLCSSSLGDWDCTRCWIGWLYKPHSLLKSVLFKLLWHLHPVEI
jgi:hypothetical protein